MDTFRRYPRTLQEAFGPATDSDIIEPPPPVDAHEWAIYIIAVGVAVVGYLGLLA
jgi:hypothetical protein